MEKEKWINHEDWIAEKKYYVKLTMEMIEDILNQIEYGPFIENVGCGLYKIGKGVYTGIQGVNEFEKAIRNSLQKQNFFTAMRTKYDPNTSQKINKILDKIDETDETDGTSSKIK